MTKKKKKTPNKSIIALIIVLVLASTAIIFNTNRSNRSYFIQTIVDNETGKAVNIASFLIPKNWQVIKCIDQGNGINWLGFTNGPNNCSHGEFSATIEANTIVYDNSKTFDTYLEFKKYVEDQYSVDNYLQISEECSHQTCDIHEGFQYTGIEKCTEEILEHYDKDFCDLLYKRTVIDIGNNRFLTITLNSWVHDIKDFNIKEVNAFNEISNNLKFPVF